MNHALKYICEYQITDDSTPNLRYPCIKNVDPQVTNEKHVRANISIACVLLLVAIMGLSIDELKFEEHMGDDTE